MDFEGLFQLISILIDFVKPVGGLVYGFFQGLFASVLHFQALFYIMISFVLLKIFVDIFSDLAKK